MRLTLTWHTILHQSKQKTCFDLLLNLMYSTKIKRNMTQFGRLRTKCPTLGFLIRKTLCRLCGQVPALTPSPCPSPPPVVTIFIELCGCGQEHLLCLPLITQEISINPSIASRQTTLHMFPDGGRLSSYTDCSP